MIKDVVNDLPITKTTLVLTYSLLIRGFDKWLEQALPALVPLYSGPALDFFDTLEDFAVEVFFEQLAPFVEDDPVL